jgi:hypothetical protein
MPEADRLATEHELTSAGMMGNADPGPRRSSARPPTFPLATAGTRSGVEDAAPVDQRSRNRCGQCSSQRTATDDYPKRKQTVEPLYGDTKHDRSFIRFHR